MFLDIVSFYVVFDLKYRAEYCFFSEINILTVIDMVSRTLAWSYG